MSCQHEETGLAHVYWTDPKAPWDLHFTREVRCRSCSQLLGTLHGPWESSAALARKLGQQWGRQREALIVEALKKRL